MEEDCRSCEWAYCPSSGCPCKLCLVKSLCSQTCEERKVVFREGHVTRYSILKETDKIKIYHTRS